MEPEDSGVFPPGREGATTAGISDAAHGIELPRGGGAVQGIAEKFAANPATGTSSLSIPLPVSHGRGLEPGLSLAYDSGNGNGAFGLGWQLGIPQIVRKTENGLPQYRDEHESDVFLLNGHEDLVPFLLQDGLQQDGADWQEITLSDMPQFAGLQWQVKIYRPRIEGTFAKIERWREPSTNRTWWRLVTPDNVTTVFGFNQSAQVFDPHQPGKTFRWLIDFVYDDKGNVTRYVYARENHAQVEFKQSHEYHREYQPQAQCYLKKICYGIKQSRFAQGLTDEALYEHEFADRDFLFQTVFDYGDHVDDTPDGDLTRWPVRADAFSSFRAGFEVRTYRRCQRVMLFHDFAQLGLQPELVQSLQLSYTEQGAGLSFLTHITQTGHKRNSEDELVAKSMPPLVFEYAQPAWNNVIESVDAASLEGAPAGIQAPHMQWLDLYGEGLKGVLSEHAGTLSFKRNLGQGQWGLPQVLATGPTMKGFGNTWQLADLEANGERALVASSDVVSGYYAADSAGGWAPFRPFSEIPQITSKDANVRVLDLSGDGRPDLLLAEERVFRWYPSRGTDGYASSQIATAPVDAAGRPEVVFQDAAESILTADMTGDGLADLVRIRNGNVVYWPNMGYGRFGNKITMSQAPQFDHADQFSPRNLRLVDLDGSGLSDLVYLGNKEFRFWLNGSGNTWLDAPAVINPFTELHNYSDVSVVDLLGTGTACVVWTSPLPAHRGRSIRYIDLMQSTKPYLMDSYHNGAGKSISLSYTPSTQFYLDDEQRGEPWITKLHFPVHCLSKVETSDDITGARFTSSYSYHHGYYDHAEREFRGFGRVDQINSESYQHFVKSGSSNVVEEVLHQTPSLVKTWFHTGAYLDQARIFSRYEDEYYTHPNVDKFKLPQPEISADVDVAEWREAVRACKGSVIRRETYGLDGTDNELHPFSVELTSVAIKTIQPRLNNRHGVFQVLQNESISLSLDRNPEDPRVAHSLVLATNAYGNPIRSASVNYGRKLEGPEEIRAEQSITQCVISETDYTNDVLGLLGDHEMDHFEAVLRGPTAWRQQSFELGLPWDWAAQIFRPADLTEKFEQASEVDYSKYRAQLGEKRLLSAGEQYFANATLDDHLPAGQLNPLGIGWMSYQLAFTRDSLEAIYGDKVSVATLEGGYVDVYADGRWWVPSGRPVFHDPDTGGSVQERFFIPFGSMDALGAASWIVLDEYQLLPVSTSTSMVGYDSGAPHQINETIAVNDYRTLQASFVRDVNNNWSGVETDELGLVVKAAVMGKVAGADAAHPPAADALTEGDNLANPTSEVHYGFYDAASGSPAWTHTKQYTQHFAATPLRSEIVQQYEYADGSGNVVMTKAQAKPGLAKQLQADGRVVDIDTGTALRWIGNGRTIINNAGQPVKKYEPYFSVTHAYEDAAELVETGPSPIIFYDAAGRNICTLNPDQTYQKAQFDAWCHKPWDANDTLLADGQMLPAEDPDVGHLFAALETEENPASWYNARINGALGSEAQRAAQITEAHAGTPNEIHSDALGRTIYVCANNGGEGKYCNRTHLDIEGNALSVTDARGNSVMSFKYNLLPPSDEDSGKSALYQNSMDSGESWVLFDIQGKMIKSWDSRDHLVENEFDGLHRPTHAWLTELGTKKLVGTTAYVDSDHPQATDLRLDNLLGSAIEVYDQAGRSRTRKLDFKGNVLLADRTLAQDYKQTVDWQTDPQSQLEEEVFQSASQYDALNRVTYAESPHHANIPASITRPQYNASGALDKMWANIRGQGDQLFVDEIDYDAKGQRMFIRYGNGLTTTYGYDDKTYRLNHLLTTTQDGRRLQDLRYWYDPIGNITEIQDGAQQAVFFANNEVQAHHAYQYDALYRLTSATGREHASQANLPHYENGRVPLSAGNDAALLRYTQAFTYDSVGNLQQMAHRRVNAANDGWTRHYRYAEESNRLLATTLGDPTLNFDEQFIYNAQGSIAFMPRFSGAQSEPNMHWDYSEQLRQVDLGGGGRAHYVYEASGQRVRKVIETNGAFVKERIYLGGWEIYRERNASGVQLERETLHVMDDQSRIAIVETKTFGDAGDEGFNPVIRYQLGDHLGSASLEVGAAGDVISYEEFHPYGTTAYHAGSSIVTRSRKRYRYTGKERDEETGFSYHGARYLCPLLGRWISSDPIGIEDGVNVYIYVHNNPIGNHDPTGTQDVPAQTNSEYEGGHIPEIRAQKYDWVQAHVDMLLARTTPEQYANQYGSGFLHLDNAIYRMWYLGGTVSKGVYGNLTGTKRTDVSYEAAEIIGNGLLFWGPVKVARLEQGIARQSTMAVEASAPTTMQRSAAGQAPVRQPIPPSHQLVDRSASGAPMVPLDREIIGDLVSSEFDLFLKNPLAAQGTRAVPRGVDPILLQDTIDAAFLWKYPKNSGYWRERITWDLGFGLDSGGTVRYWAAGNSKVPEDVVMGLSSFLNKPVARLGAGKVRHADIGSITPAHAEGFSRKYSLAEGLSLRGHVTTRHACPGCTLEAVDRGFTLITDSALRTGTTGRL